MFENSPDTNSVDHENLLRIGPWPVRRFRSEGQALNPINNLRDSGLSFSETMAQIDEVYATTREMEGFENRAMYSPACYTRDWDEVFRVLTLLH